ncbi:MAG: thioesterase family protein [Anaerolineae bacterium]|nr:thioesterase family protein [Anaerolineae bacterium]
MPKLPPLPLEQLTALPAVYRLTIPPEYEDYNGHMNIRWYLGIFDDAGLPLYDDLGLTPARLHAQGYTTFDLEHHIQYAGESLVGDAVTVTVRFLGRSARRMHYQMYLLNDTRAALSATFECVNAFVDLNTRRMTDYPPAIAAKLDALLAAHQALPWAAPVCGVMRA